MLKIDLHIHSIASGHAFNTVYEIAEAARDKGLEMIGIADHGPAVLGAPVIPYFYVTKRVPKKLFGVEVLMGCEANILDSDGKLDLPKEHLSMQAILFAGLHKWTGYTGKTKKDNTQAIIGAIRSPFVHAISHPFDPHYFPVDVEAIVKAASEHNVALEINCIRLKRFRKFKKYIEKTGWMIEHAQDRGVKMLISTDAHVASEIGDDSIIDELDMRRIIKEECILNTSTLKVKDFLEVKNRAKPKFEYYGD
jgi:putative hydrolase